MSRVRGRAPVVPAQLVAALSLIAAIGILAAKGAPSPAGARSTPIAQVAFIRLHSLGLTTESGRTIRLLVQLNHDDPYLDGEPRWSPDGTSIAYSVVRIYGDPDAYRGGQVSDLYAVSVGSRARTLIARNVEDVSGEPPAAPSWSPDGDRLAYMSWPVPSSATRPSIRLVTPDGKHNVLFHPCARAPAWSPDSTKIAFAGWPHGIACSGARSGIMTVSPQGTHQRQLTTLGDSPTWSPNSTEIAYVRSGDIWVMNADGTHQRQLTHTPMRESAPVWSPDAHLIAYIRQDRRTAHIFTIRATGQGAKQRSFGAGYDAGISWSPDGRNITYHRIGGEVFTLDTATSKQRLLIAANSAAWGPVK